MGWGTMDISSFMQQKGEVAESYYNSSFQKITRLHDSLLAARRHWRGGSLEELNFELDYIWIELEADATDPQRKVIKRVNQRLLILQAFQKRAKTKEQYVYVRNKYSELIKKKWIFLFRVEKTQGLGKRYKNSDDKIF